MAKGNKSQNELDQRIRSYWYLLNHENGDQKDIMDINPDFLVEFASAGFITIGINAVATPRFMTTDLGREYAKEAYVALCSELAHDDYEELFR